MIFDSVTIIGIKQLLIVNEIFFSIQGESSYAGLPCIFIRLTGCNLRCSYCDTKYAFSAGQEKTAAEILGIIRQYKCNLVEITGGEPLEQEECPRLASFLLEKGYIVLVETNGSHDIDILPQGCVRIMDVKCPSSGMLEYNHL